MGTPIVIQRKKEISTPTRVRMKPRPITFGGVPTGVASPPTDAAKLVISIRPVA
jgi:hypothetical protein